MPHPTAWGNPYSLLNKPVHFPSMSLSFSDAQWVFTKGYNEKKNKSRQVPYWDLISLVFYFAFFAIANKSRNQRPVLKHAKFNTYTEN